MKMKVVEPYRAYLYFDALKTFDLQLQSVFKKHNLLNIKYSNVVTMISETLDQIHLPNFVIQFDTWLKTQPTSKSDRYIDYFKTDTGKWRSGLKKTNIYIEFISEYICNSTIQNIDLFLLRLKKDYLLLKSELNLPLLSLDGEIFIAGGDRHEDGQQPITLSLDNLKVIYKPRDSQVDNLLNEICEMAELPLICPKTISQGNYLWQEYVDNSQAISTDDISQVYNKYGNILAVADMLNINDCHFENFIVNRNNVWFIDPETSFQYFFDDNELFNRSIYQTGLIQSSDAVENGIGHTSAITAIGTIFHSYTQPYPINDASELIQVKYERDFIKKTQNYPHINKTPIPPLEYVNDILNGYNYGFDKLINNKEKIINLLINKKNIKPRYLIRTTAYYLIVMNKIMHPDNVSNYPASLRKISDEYLHYKDAHPLFAKLIPYEIDSLRKYNVPIFYIDINSRDLMDGDGGIYVDFFPCSPLQQIENYFSRDGEYVLKQNELIKRSIDVTCL